MYKKKLFILACLCVAVMVFAVVCATACDASNKAELVTVYNSGEKYISPSSLCFSGDDMFVADYTSCKVYKLTGGQIVKTYDFNGEAVNKVYSSGDSIYVLVGGLQGKVYAFDASLNLKTIQEAGHTPKDIVADDNNVYVINRFSNDLYIFDKNLSTKGEKIALVGAREPFALEYAGGKLYIASHLNTSSATEKVVGASMTVFDTTTKLIDNVQLLNGTSNINDITLSSDKTKLYLTNTFGRYSYPTTQLDRGWVNTNGITVFDISTDEVIAGVLIDGVEQGEANPWGIGVIGTGVDAKIVCAVSGLSRLAVLKEKEMLNKIDKVKKGEFGYTTEEIVNHVEFASDFEDIIYVGGKGVRELVLRKESNKEYAYVTQYFDGTISKVNLEKDDNLNNEVTAISLGTQGKNTKERIGESLWCDATICYQGWESCSSCHPEGRSDSLNWDEAGDGLGTAKQTKSMLYAHRTPPVLVTGSVDFAETNVAETVEYAFHNDLSEEYIECMDAYLKSLQPVQSPYLNKDGSLTDSALRGKELFETLHCSSCHGAPYYTDMQFHLMQGSLDVDDTPEDRPLDTPTLVEIWRTYPWLFNGSATSMKDAIKIILGDNANNVTEADLDDLSAYVLSIGNLGEYYGVEEIILEDFMTDDRVYNTVIAGYTVKSISVRKQLLTDKNATVTLKVFDKDGNVCDEYVKATLKNMNVGDYAIINCNLVLPDTVSNGGYIQVEIVNSKDDSDFIASTVKIFSK